MIIQPTQAIYAGFLMGEYQLPLGIRGMAGARVEAGSQNVKTFSPFTGDDPVIANFRKFRRFAGRQHHVAICPRNAITCWVWTHGDAPRIS